MNCKVRFAPSPTGFMHIGNARIAIINYLFCKKNKGKFLFRIDDTDSQRSKKEYENSILEDMNWLGITYDETFRQSERLDRYQEVMNQLTKKGVLYKCFETAEDLEYKRRIAISKGKPPVYDREALKLSSNDISKLENEGVPSYWRFKLPNKTISWNDLILGEVSYDLNSVSDPVIIKADGTFLYTFSSVVDDFDSGITHIIRGQDHVTNTAVQIALFNEISGTDYKVTFAHLSLLVNKDGSQFSKRLGSTNLGDIRKQGVDPMAIMDLLATLGSSADTLPFSKIEDLIQYFDIAKFSSNSPKFDIEYILKLNRKIFHSKSYNEISKFGISKKAFEVIKENIDSYKDFDLWKDILSSNYISNYDPNDAEKKVIDLFQLEIKKISELSEDNLKSLLVKIKNELNLSGKELYTPLRKTLTGQEHGPNMIQLMILLGRKEIIRRLGF